MDERVGEHVECQHVGELVANERGEAVPDLHRGLPVEGEQQLLSR
jgi:hypothetical protein